MMKLDEKGAKRIFKVTAVVVSVWLLSLLGVGVATAVQWDDYEWADMSLIWYRDSANLNNHLVSGASTQAGNSIAQWRSSNTGAAIDFTEETSYPDESQVDILDMDFDSSWGCVPGYGCFTLGGDGETIIAGQAWLNNDDDGDCYFEWYTNGTMDNSSYTPAKVDVRTVTIHELGHTLGLGDDCTPSGCVMCANWTQKWDVTEADKNDLKGIYP